MPLQFEARKVALKQDRTGFVLTLSLHPDEIPEELIRDFVGARYMCVMARLNDDESHTPYNNRTQKAAMLCKSPDFQEFMVRSFMAEDANEDSCAAALCSYCGIKSRTELNGNEKARNLFDEILTEYNNDKSPF